MSIPNIITLGRLLAVPLMVWLILVGQMAWAFWIFVAAGVSDGVDGFIARAFRARTPLGAYLDPLADKALLVSAYIVLGHEGHLPVWLVILVVFRDVLIVGGVLLLYTLKESLAMQPSWISKLNTVTQIALIVLVLAEYGIDPVAWGLDIDSAIRIMTWVVGATTALSGAGYIVQGARLMSRLGGTR